MTTLYHGTNARFETFSDSHMSDQVAQYGMGHYFSHDKESAARYGTNVITARVDLKNPLIIRSEEHPNLHDIHLSELGTKLMIQAMPDEQLRTNIEDYVPEYQEEKWTAAGKAHLTHLFIQGYANTLSLQELENLYGRFIKEFHVNLRQLAGYDGLIISKNGEPDMTIAWFSEQIQIVCQSQ